MYLWNYNLKFKIIYKLHTKLIVIICLQEYEKKMLPWIYTFAVFTIFRLLAFLFFSIVNDMIFAYNIIMCLLWTIFIIFSVYGWVLVYSLYIELSDLTRLEDLAHLRVSFDMKIKHYCFCIKFSLDHRWNPLFRHFWCCWI